MYKPATWCNLCTNKFNFSRQTYPMNMVIMFNNGLTYYYVRSYVCFIGVFCFSWLHVTNS